MKKTSALFHAGFLANWAVLNTTRVRGTTLQIGLAIGRACQRVQAPQYTPILIFWLGLSMSVAGDPWLDVPPQLHLTQH